MGRRRMGPLCEGRLAASRARFETALALDDAFAETQGALAVLDLLGDDLEGARRRTEIALGSTATVSRARLPRACCSSAKARGRPRRRSATPP